MGYKYLNQLMFVWFDFKPYQIKKSNGLEREIKLKISFMLTNTSDN